MAMIIGFIIFNIVLIGFQIILASNEKKIIGLIIPGFNILLALALALFTSPYSSSTTQILNGVEVTNTTVNMGGFIWAFSKTLILLLIPAAINLSIYFVKRHKINEKKKSDINKMKINDLV